MMVNDHMPERGGPRFPEGDQEKKMTKPIFVHEFYVMDYGWDMFLTVPEMVEKLSKSPHEYHILESFLKFTGLANECARKADVTGGFTTDVLVMPLIDDEHPSFALIWKAGRGGWCVVVSERKIPWLEAIDSCTLTVIDDLYN